MNFLGHIYFSNNDLELMHANLFGDFVKGRNLEGYAPEVQEGIILHRAIDTYIGQHEAVKQLSKDLSGDLPKVATIAIDIFFDHFLAIHWNKFHDTPLDQYLAQFYEYSVQEDLYPNERFLDVLFRMKKGQWLSGYQNMQGIAMACEGVSQRLSFPNTLKYGRYVLEQHYERVEEAFFVYMKDAQSQFSKR